MPYDFRLPPEMRQRISLGTPPSSPNAGMGDMDRIPTIDEATAAMGGPMEETVEVSAQPLPTASDWQLTANIPGLLTGDQRNTVTSRTLEEWLAKQDPKEAKKKKIASKIGSFLTGAAAGASVTGNPGWTRAYELSRQGEMDQRSLDAADLENQSRRINQGLDILKTDQTYRRGEGDLMNDFSVGPDGTIVRNRDIEDVRKQILLEQYFPEEAARQRKIKEMELGKAEAEIGLINARTASTKAQEQQRIKSLQVAQARIEKMRSEGRLSDSFAKALLASPDDAIALMKMLPEGATEADARQLLQTYYGVVNGVQGQAGAVFSPMTTTPGINPAAPPPPGRRPAAAPPGGVNDAQQRDLNELDAFLTR
jgi:hypothetical protein